MINASYFIRNNDAIGVFGRYSIAEKFVVQTDQHIRDTCADEQQQIIPNNVFGYFMIQRESRSFSSLARSTGRGRFSNRRGTVSRRA